MSSVDLLTRRNVLVESDALGATVPPSKYFGRLANREIFLEQQSSRAMKMRKPGSSPEIWQSTKKSHVLKGLAAAFAFCCLTLTASAQQIVKELLPTPPKGDKLEARLVVMTIPPGAVGRWHTYPNHPVVYVAEGTLTLEFRNAEPKVYKAGEGFVEPINTVLRGANRGTTQVSLVMFQLSPPDVPDAVDATFP